MISSAFLPPQVQARMGASLKVGTEMSVFYGGCHRDDEKTVFAELRDIVEEIIALYRQEGQSLPLPTPWPSSIGGSVRVV